MLCADDDEAAAEAGVEADGRCELGRGWLVRAESRLWWLLVSQAEVERGWSLWCSSWLVVSWSRLTSVGASGVTGDRCVWMQVAVAAGEPGCRSAGAEAAGEPVPRRAVGNRDECFGVGRGVDRNSDKK